MSTTYVTYCSAPKRRDPGKLPAAERYLSDRIRMVEDLAKRDGVGFLILSGTYGLIERDYPLPWYDHLLAVEEIEPMANRAAARLLELQVESIVWFTVDPRHDPYVIRYANVMEIAASDLTLEMSTRFVVAED